MEGLQKSGAWELAPNHVTFTEEEQNDEVFGLSGEEYDAYVEGALQDPTWYAADGTRYSAMFVLPDGTAYGRKGPAPEMPRPTAENGFGAFTGEGEVEQVDGGEQGAVYTNVGQDDRDRKYPLSPFNNVLTNYPPRVNGAMSPNGNTMSGSCSGAKVGPRAVLTAAHCVYNASGWFPLGYFNPGQTNTTTPNGSHAVVGLYAADYINNGRAYDYAVIFVADSQAFYNLGWLGVEWGNAASDYNGVVGKNRGYPAGPNNSQGAITVQRCADSPRADLRCDGWMYGMDLTMTSAAFWTGNLLAYHNDVSYGHSGSAIYNSNNAAIGVVTHQEPCPSQPGGVCQWYDPCHGPRFRTAMWNDVCSWIADPNFQSAFGQHSLCQ